MFSQQNKFQGEESSIYLQHLNTLQKSYSELTMVSHKRLNDLEMLQDFIQSATTELIWLNEKEEVEISRDWSSKSLNVAEIQRYYEVFKQKGASPVFPSRDSLALGGVRPWRRRT